MKSILSNKIQEFFLQKTYIKSNDTIEPKPGLLIRYCGSRTYLDNLWPLAILKKYDLNAYTIDENYLKIDENYLKPIHQGIHGIYQFIDLNQKIALEVATQYEWNNNYYLIYGHIDEYKLSKNKSRLSFI